MWDTAQQEVWDTDEAETRVTDQLVAPYMHLRHDLPQATELPVLAHHTENKTKSLLV